MVRWVIWAQVGFALVAIVATFADTGRLPHTFFPPGPLLMLCFLSVFVAPAVVFFKGRHRKPGNGQFREVVASVGLAVVTILSLFPLVQ